MIRHKSNNMISLCVTKYFVIQYVAKRIFIVLVSSNSVTRIYIIRSAVSFCNICLHSRISSMISRTWQMDRVSITQVRSRANLKNDKNHRMTIHHRLISEFSMIDSYFVFADADSIKMTDESISNILRRKDILC